MSVFTISDSYTRVDCEDRSGWVALEYVRASNRWPWWALAPRFLQRGPV